MHSPSNGSFATLVGYDGLVGLAEHDQTIPRPTDSGLPWAGGGCGILCEPSGRVSRLGRYPKLRGQPALPRPGPGPAAVDVHRVSPWALHPDYVAHPRPGLRGLAHEPIRISPNESSATCGQCGPRISLGNPSHAGCPPRVRGNASGHSVRCGGGSLALRLASASRGTSSLGDRASRGSLRAALHVCGHHLSPLLGEARCKRCAQSSSLLGFRRSVQLGAPLKSHCYYSAVRVARSGRIPPTKGWHRGKTVVGAHACSSVRGEGAFYPAEHLHGGYRALRIGSH